MRGKVAWVLMALSVAWTAAAKEWPTKALSEHDRGKELYLRHCVSCHGLRAGGDGAAAASLVTPVPDFTEGFAKRPQEELVRAVLSGKGVMPGFEVAFGKDDADRVVKYMAKVGKMTEEEAAPKEEDKGGDEDEGDADVGGG
jgi:mono/diheme cytochrome c family protein